MEAEAIHLPVGFGLDMVIHQNRLSAAVPMAMIEILDDAATFGDVSCPLVLRVTAEGLIGILGNGPDTDALLAKGYAYTAVYQSGIVHRIADDILNAPYHGSALSSFLVEKTLELLSLLLGSMPESRSDLIALSASGTLRSNLLHPPPVAELARINGTTPRQLREYFHAYFGMTIPSWLSQWRLIRARKMLVDSDLPVKDIAAAVGYCQVSSFSRNFTKHFGTPPSRVRIGGRNATTLATLEGQP